MVFRWQGPFRGSPTRWKAADGEAVVRALREAEANPVDRPLGRLAKIRNEPAAVPDSDGDGVSVAEDDEPAGSEEVEPAVSVHTEIQYLLLKLGGDMGFDVHVARNDQSRMWKGQRLGGGLAPSP